MHLPFHNPRTPEVLMTCQKASVRPSTLGGNPISFLFPSICNCTFSKSAGLDMSCANAPAETPPINSHYFKCTRSPKLLTERRFPHGVVALSRSLLQHILFEPSVSYHSCAWVHQVSQELGVDALPEFEHTFFSSNTHHCLYRAPVWGLQVYIKQNSQ